MSIDIAILAIVGWIIPLLQAAPQVFTGVGVVVVAIGCGRLTYDTLKGGAQWAKAKFSEAAQQTPTKEQLDAYMAERAQEGRKIRPATS